MKKTMINYIKNGKYDEIYTPPFVVEVLLKYLPKNKKIWCPFDGKNSQYVKILTKNGYDVIYSHKNDEKDFFEYEPDEWDIIVSNPPFSIKNEVLERCFKLNKPFVLLLPITTLEGVKRGKLFRKYGIQVLVLDRRINFLDYMKGGKYKKSGNWFNSSYFCWKLLPKDLIFEKIEKKEE